MPVDLERRWQHEYQWQHTSHDHTPAAKQTDVSTSVRGIGDVQRDIPLKNTVFWKSCRSNAASFAKRSGNTHALQHSCCVANSQSFSPLPMRRRPLWGNLNMDSPACAGSKEFSDTSEGSMLAGNCVSAEIVSQLKCTWGNCASAFLRALAPAVLRGCVCPLDQGHSCYIISMKTTPAA